MGYRLSFIGLCSVSMAACGENPGATMADAWDSAVGDFNQQRVAAPQLAQRETMCSREGGRWVELIEVSACRQGVVEIAVDDEPVQLQACHGGEGATYDHACLHEDEAGRYYFNDGPSLPPLAQAASANLGDEVDIGRYNSLFWPAGVNHDYCYHHGSFRGLTKTDCDDQMLRDVTAVCNSRPEFDWFRPEVCRTQAAAMVAAVRNFGASFFAALDSEVDYPEWWPVWQQLGLTENDAYDPPLLQAESL